MADTFDYDVFISYSSADKDWVRGRLLTRLESKGIRVNRQRVQRTTSDRTDKLASERYA